jgi:non-ribosomal peptide synthetase component E (peptide arylation enzyme)
MPLRALDLIAATHLGKQMTTTLIEALHHHARSRPKSVAFQVGEDVWTCQRLVDELERLARGIQESFGSMVNYLYDVETIENNREAFVNDGTVLRSADVDALLAAEHISAPNSG